MQVRTWHAIAINIITHATELLNQHAVRGYDFGETFGLLRKKVESEHKSQACMHGDDAISSHASQQATAKPMRSFEEAQKEKSALSRDVM